MVAVAPTDLRRAHVVGDGSLFARGPVRLRELEGTTEIEQIMTVMVVMMGDCRQQPKHARSPYTRCPVTAKA